MNMRDSLFWALGAVIGILGIIGTLLWSIEIGVMALLVMSLIILALLVLQRRQLAKLQQRSLTMLNSRKQDPKPLPVKSQESLAIPTKKVVGLLQAQQISMERLNQKVDRALQIEIEDN